MTEILDKTYQIDVGYACAGIVTKNDICIEAAPIFKWMIGKYINEILKWKKIKNVTKLHNKPKSGYISE